MFSIALYHCNSTFLSKLDDRKYRKREKKKEIKYDILQQVREMSIHYELHILKVFLGSQPCQDETDLCPTLCHCLRHQGHTRQGTSYSWLKQHTARIDFIHCIYSEMDIVLLKQYGAKLCHAYLEAQASFSCQNQGCCPHRHLYWKPLSNPISSSAFQVVAVAPLQLHLVCLAAAVLVNSKSSTLLQQIQHIFTVSEERLHPRSIHYRSMRTRNNVHRLVQAYTITEWDQKIWFFFKVHFKTPIFCEINKTVTFMS